MKRILYPVLALSLAVLACSIPTPVTPTVTPVVTEPPVVANVTCNELSFYLDPALASGFDCKTKDESPYEMEMYPAHTEVTLQGYVLSDKFFEPLIAVYPVQAYINLLPDHIPARVTELQTLIGGAPAPVFGDSFSDSLPFLPTFNAAQVFFVGYQLLPFQSGGGIRYMTEFAQYFAPVNNTDLFYTYQGLTPDGLYWVSAILPINNPILPADANSPPGGVSWEDFSNNFELYITEILNQLNAQSPDSYTPSLAALDALVSSISIAP